MNEKFNNYFSFGNCGLVYGTIYGGIGMKPMLFFQAGAKEFESRIRIIMPNGKCETSYGTEGRTYSTCWARNSKSTKEVLKRMKQYDKLCQFPKALFLGYL